MSRKAITIWLLPAVLLLASASGAAGIDGNALYKSRSIHATGKLCRIDVNYPIFSGINKAAEVNSSVLKLAKGQVEEFKNGTSTSEESSFSGTFKVAAVSSEIVSVRFIFENRCPPSGRPAESIVEFNYSPQLGEPLSLADIFKDSIQYENFLSAIALDELIDKEEIKSSEAATEADKGNFDDFALTNSGIDLHFGSSVESEYSAAVMSKHVVHIPWSRITSLLSPDSPAYAIAHCVHARSNQKEITEDNFESAVGETFIEAYSKAIRRFRKEAHAYRKRAEWRSRIGQVALAKADTKQADDLEAEQRLSRASAESSGASPLGESSTQMATEQPPTVKNADKTSLPGWVKAAIFASVVLALFIVSAWKKGAIGRKRNKTHDN